MELREAEPRVTRNIVVEILRLAKSLQGANNYWSHTLTVQKFFSPESVKVPVINSGVPLTTETAVEAVFSIEGTCECWVKI